jgi:hypothetical protein
LPAPAVRNNAGFDAAIVLAFKINDAWHFLLPLGGRSDLAGPQFIEPAQRRSVLDRTGIGNPRRQDCPLFRRCQLRVAGDVTGMSVDRGSVSTAADRVDWKRLELWVISILRNQASRP